MSESLSITEFLAQSAAVPLIDVRSPKEFAQGHIPGAVNIPLFDDDERARVGTTYKQKGSNTALLEGLDIVGPKMSGFVRQAQKIAAGGKILVHCWRGGMRSSSFAWLLNSAGMQAFVLRGGYKTYRNHVISGFSARFRLLIVGGETGSGKTEIISRIAAAGEQVIDIEAIAKHRGSAFGALGQDLQPGVEQFENDLFAAFAKLDYNRTIWLEDESRSIGRVFIPAALWEQMEHAPVFRIRIPQEIRLKRLLREYGTFAVQDLEASVMKIRKRLGDMAAREAVDALHQGNLEETARIALTYYDKAYDHMHARKKYENVFFCDSATDDAQVNANNILKLAAETGTA
ncbi:MAG: tRNA 2-selenouridine synthase [Bacteroidetes bacterium]|nr:MAG: tRNA 2-selenouridine synthase [Bacteroidota bacterium]